MCCYTVTKSFKFLLFAALVVTAAACGKSDTAQASNRDGEPKSVGVAIVQKASVPAPSTWSALSQRSTR